MTRHRSFRRVLDDSPMVEWSMEPSARSGKAVMEIESYRRVDE